MDDKRDRVAIVKLIALLGIPYTCVRMRKLKADSRSLRSSLKFSPGGLQRSVRTEKYILARGKRRKLRSRGNGPEWNFIPSTCPADNAGAQIYD